ncbi:MAG: GNAT family N-acetyltransferase [Saprospiraceae bacterium]|uniref:GNAT family N-acetyltransferase n=1 Tax=Candidatus Opimibacter skivensis TaxID=2982028 RepID=A0A9D7SWM3_9BACT|nr:GNAT family N-acetyltransferase [Candidatus Opimibacter skivensis]
MAEGIFIQEFIPIYQSQVTDHILDIENNEFNMNLTLDMQPDLADIHAMYQKQKGNFWIALHDDQVIGTTGIYYLNNSGVELRRMFVKATYRGNEFGVGQHLLDSAISWTKENGFKEIFLETTDWLTAASRFYLKNNFTYISKDKLPRNLPVLRNSGKFMSLLV